jgi:RNA polymerase sigma-70 factor (ECF subfamily)
VGAKQPKDEAELHGPSGDKPLDALLARVRERDEAAARELVERLYPLVAQIVQTHLPRRDDLEDLMQEVFLKMFSRLDQFRGDAPFEHWVSRMALTTCLDRLRRQRVRPELRWSDLSDDEQSALFNLAGPSQPADGDASAAFGILEQLLKQLTTQDAWLIRQVELEDKTLTEVCAAAGWNSGAARVRLFRARRRLQAAFRELERKGNG